MTARYDALRTASQEMCLQWLTPLRMVFLGIFSYALVFTVAPVRVAIEFSLPSVLYFAACILMFLAGILTNWVLPVYEVKTYSPPQRDYKKLYRIVMGLGILGGAFRFYDRFFVRGIDFTQNVLERRETLEAAGSSIWSMAAALLFPLCFAVPFSYLLLEQHSRIKPKKIHYVLALTVFFLPVADSVSIGSRSLIITASSLFFMTLLFFGRIEVRLRTMAVAVIAGLALVVLSTWIFMQRLSAMGLLALASVVHSGYAFTLQPSAWAQEMLNRTQSTFWFLPIFVFVNLCQYALHGIYEFFYFYDHFSGPHTLGQDMFGVYFRLSDVLLGGKSTPAYVLSLQPRPGVYTSFLGPVYGDFGWFGPFFMMLLGFAVEKLRSLARFKSIGVVPLYFYLILVIFLFPVVNMISNAEGLFVITAFGLFYLLYDHACRTSAL